MKNLRLSFLFTGFLFLSASATNATDEVILDSSEIYWVEHALPSRSGFVQRDRGPDGGPVFRRLELHDEFASPIVMGRSEAGEPVLIVQAPSGDWEIPIRIQNGISVVLSAGSGNPVAFPPELRFKWANHVSGKGTVVVSLRDYILSRHSYAGGDQSETELAREYVERFRGERTLVASRILSFEDLPHAAREAWRQIREVLESKELDPALRANLELQFLYLASIEATKPIRMMTKHDQLSYLVRAYQLLTRVKVFDGSEILFWKQEAKLELLVRLAAMLTARDTHQSGILRSRSRIFNVPRVWRGRVSAGIGVAAFLLLLQQDFVAGKPLVSTLALGGAFSLSAFVYWLLKAPDRDLQRRLQESHAYWLADIRDLLGEDWNIFFPREVSFCQNILSANQASSP